MSFASPSTSTPLPHPVLTLLLALEGGWLRKTTLLGILRLLDNWHPIEIARPWCWEILKAGGERDGKGWDGWMASRTQWTWVWASSWSWWWIGKPGVLQSMGWQRVRHDWATELNWTERQRRWSLNIYLFLLPPCKVTLGWLCLWLCVTVSRTLHSCPFWLLITITTLYYN